MIEIRKGTKRVEPGKDYEKRGQALMACVGGMPWSPDGRHWFSRTSTGKNEYLVVGKGESEKEERDEFPLCISRRDGWRIYSHYSNHHLESRR